MSEDVRYRCINPECKRQHEWREGLPEGGICCFCGSAGVRFKVKSNEVRVIPGPDSVGIAFPRNRKELPEGEGGMVFTMNVHHSVYTMRRPKGIRLWWGRFYFGVLEPVWGYLAGVVMALAGKNYWAGWEACEDSLMPLDD